MGGEKKEDTPESIWGGYFHHRAKQEGKRGMLPSAEKPQDGGIKEMELEKSHNGQGREGNLQMSSLRHLGSKERKRKKGRCQ